MSKTWQCIRQLGLASRLLFMAARMHIKENAASPTKYVVLGCLLQRRLQVLNPEAQLG